MGKSLRYLKNMIKFLFCQSIILNKYLLYCKSPPMMVHVYFDIHKLIFMLIDNEEKLKSLSKKLNNIQHIENNE